MKILLTALVFLAVGCKHVQPSANDSTSSHDSPVQPRTAVRDEWTVDTSGDPYLLSLKQGVFAFCDDRGGHTFDLQTRLEVRSKEECVKPQFFHGEWTGCSDASLNTMVQSPQNDPNDNIVFGRSAYPLKGRADDCDNDGMIGVIGTAEEVLLIDGQRERWAILSQEMGQPVAIGSGWVAWCPNLEHKVRLVRQTTDVWKQPPGTR